MSRSPVGYVSLVRGNRDFRNLWLGNVVSLLGDWLNFVALISLILGLTGSPLALGLVFVAKLFPAAIAAPVAGLIVDRFNRRRLMIVCDILRAVIVLGLLVVDDSGDVILAYVLTTLQVIVSGVFQPAQSASVPNVTSKDELLTANALMAASWSVMLAMGAALGGFATAFFGPKAVFVMDSASYLVSAGFILATTIPQATESGSGKRLLRSAARDIVTGWRRMRDRPEIGRIALTKSVWAIGGGGLVFSLALVGTELMPAAPDIGLGWVFAARGVGTGIGPILVRRYMVNRSRWPVALGVLVSVCGAAYAVLGIVPWSVYVVLLIMVAHAAGGANWVLSTVILQERSIDAYRGRIFATEWLLVMTAESLSILAAGALMEAGVLDLRGTIVALGAIQIVCGLLWVGWIRKREPAT